MECKPSEPDLGCVINAMWQRMSAPSGEGARLVPPKGLEDEMRAIVRMLRGVRRGLHLGMDMTKEMEQLVEALSMASASFFHAYYGWRLISAREAGRSGQANFFEL